jgi:hypothetical protein
LRRPAGEVLYVGHDAQHLAAAARAGMRTAAVNFAPGAQAEHLLARWEELLHVVDSLSATSSAISLTPATGACQAAAVVHSGRRS